MFVLITRARPSGKARIEKPFFLICIGCRALRLILSEVAVDFHKNYYGQLLSLHLAGARIFYVSLCNNKLLLNEIYSYYRNYFNDIEK